MSAWQFYKHRGLMDLKGSVPGYSSFLSRFTHPEELVCVTLLANREGVGFTNLGRRIAGAFGDLLSTGYDDNRLHLTEGQLPVAETVARLERELKKRGIPLFGKFDHAENARKAGHSEDAGIDGEPSPKGGKYLLNLSQIPPDPVLQKGLDPVFLHFLWILSQELI